MKRALLSIALIGLVFALVSCAMFSGRMLTPKQEYVEALTLFNSVYKTYLDQYDLASPPVQAEWKAKIDPAMSKASRALDAWRMVLVQGGDPAVSEWEFRNMKNEALALLFEYGILRVEE